MLLDSNDAVIDDPQDLRAHIINFYQGLLGCPVLETASSPDLIARLDPYRCSADAINILSAPVTALEIKETVFSLPKNKSP